MFRTVIVLIAAVGALGAASAASARAATLSDFRVEDAGSTVRYSVNVCTGSAARLMFTAYLRAEDGGGAVYPTRWTVTQPAGCRRWRLDAPDLYPSGRWTAQLRLVVRDRHYRTPARPLTLA